MNVREKLVELLGADTCKHDCCEVCEYYKDEDACIAYLKNSMAENLIARGVTVSEWVSVKDRLPENDYGKHWKERRYYLVRLAPSGLMRVAHYGYKEYDWWIDEHDCVLSATSFTEVTHWMEITNLPQPPKEENSAPNRC